MLASYGPDRQLQWAVNTTISYSGDVLDVATSDDGAAVIWLSIDETTVLGAGLASETSVAILGEFGDDHLLARYSADGELEWVHLIGSADAGEEEYRSLGVRPSGEIVVSGDIGPGAVIFGGSDELIVDMAESSRLGVGVFAADGTLAWLLAALGGGAAILVRRRAT